VRATKERNRLSFTEQMSYSIPQKLRVLKFDEETKSKYSETGANAVGLCCFMFYTFIYFINCSVICIVLLYFIFCKAKFYSCFFVHFLFLVYVSLCVCLLLVLNGFKGL
jgi:hypothetical protein